MSEETVEIEQTVLFEERFLDFYTGRKLLHDPITAIVELVANAWDAGSTRVDIAWPDDSNNEITIGDNGEGMTEEEFKRRWRTLSYNRLADQGELVQVVGQDNYSPRRTFGRNGTGRFAGFCFADKYQVITSKNGRKISYLVQKGDSLAPIKLSKIEESISASTGTTIKVNSTLTAHFNPEKIKTEIGLRFLTDPKFEVYVNNSRVDFTDLSIDGVDEFDVNIDKYKENVRIILIDAKRTDRTTKQHGVAWQVNGRLVGSCSWLGSGQEALIDGRRIEAKRYTFIIFADILNDPDIVKSDWSGFQEDNEKFIIVQKAIQGKIREILLGLTKEKRQETFRSIHEANAEKLSCMSPISRERWKTFVEKAQDQCPSIAEKDLIALSGVLANLESTNSRYALIHQLHELKPEQLNDLYKVLNEWNMDSIKMVLDELQWRLKLLDELQKKLSTNSTLEVQELQPLFERGLWIFGPEFETIEYTSNRGMTTVIQKLFNSDDTGTLNRPDFAILPDASVGLYSYPEYDDEFAEVSVASLVIVELKKPGVTIGADEKGQCWKYVKELYAKGHLTDKTKVRCCTWYID